jgi:acetolactate synthase-1/2/3 large subunit
MNELANEVTGAELIAQFIAKKCFPKVFLVTGGACAFIVDALGQNSETDYVCMQHEQAAAMAADAVWRTSSLVGVTVATSGPGATNLITGIACSWFDSIPSLHITGQVNQRESSAELGVNVRQAGFQETDIVEIVRPITKHAVKVKSTRELAEALQYSLSTALEGRMGPVLIDVPMDVQQSVCSLEEIEVALGNIKKAVINSEIGQRVKTASEALEAFIDGSSRPLVVLGAGLSFGESMQRAQQWCEESGIPYCSSWGGFPFIDRAASLYQGSIGVYGSRLANWAIQSADRIVVLGSRLDNRQRTGNPAAFAPFAQFFVIDIDAEELAKYRNQDNYQTHNIDLHLLDKVLPNVSDSLSWESWTTSLHSAALTMDSGFAAAVGVGELSPYDVVPRVQSSLSKDAIVVADCGANLCWVYQSFLPSAQLLFTAGGNSPMAYSVPAAIGAKIAEPNREVVCFIGDGGFQMNIQELQTIKNYDLSIKIIILNNDGYGIIKQFQDAYFDSRYEATGRGYSVPDFGLIVKGYGIEYRKVISLDDLDEALAVNGACVIDVALPPNTLITPKVEMNRFIHDQFPYGTLMNRTVPLNNYPDHPSQLNTSST